MKWAFKAAAYCCGGIMGVAAAAWDAEWCSGISFVMILLGCGCSLIVCLRELAIISDFEKKEREAVLRSARKAEFFRELDKL